MAPTSTGSGSTRSPSGPATRSRSASSVSCSMPVSPRDRQRPTQGVNPSATPRRMTIGAVLAALAPDFPDVTISKIRLLPALGDVSPSRPQVPVLATDPDLPGASALRRRGALRMTDAELREASGLDRPTFEALSTFGLVRPDSSGHYGEPSLAVARAASALAAYGIEPRHLRAFRTAADREIGLVQQVLSPIRGRTKGTGAKVAHDPTSQILAECIALHTALVKAAIAAE